MGSDSAELGRDLHARRPGLFRSAAQMLGV
jgi:hypothetical protein